MPSLHGWTSWPAPPPYVPSHATADESSLRPCGCRVDPVVFGCPHGEESSDE